MPFGKFENNDIFYNKVKTFPQSTFVIYDGRVYYNNLKNDKQEFGNLHGTSQGFVSLYELNVDRVIDTGAGEPPDGKSIYPFITKDGARIAFKTVSTSEFDSSSQFAYGDVIKSKYPLTSSIKTIALSETSNTFVEISNDERFHGSYTQLQGSNKKFISSLKNTFNYYIPLSHHYAYDASATEGLNAPIVNWNKSLQAMNLIEIPSIFYGSQIKKGSVSLKFYITGTLAAELTDSNKDGELIQVSGTINAAQNDGKVGGVVLYNEGFLALTGSWDINPNHTDKYVGNDFSNPKWKNFGRGAFDNTSMGVITGSAFRLSFEGVNYVSTMTMMAHMPKGMYNNSTNPTAYHSSSLGNPVTSSNIYRENADLLFAKLEHQDYPDPTGSFKKQTYVSKIGIYDEQKRLIGVAKLANPVRKTEDREYTFKLKLDF